MRNPILMHRLNNTSIMNESLNSINSTAKILLKNIIDEASEILQIIDNRGPIEDWVQSKLSIAEDYITTAKKYLQYVETPDNLILSLIPKVNPIELKRSQIDSINMPSISDMISTDDFNDDNIRSFKKPEAEYYDAIYSVEPETESGDEDAEYIEDDDTEYIDDYEYSEDMDNDGIEYAEDDEDDEEDEEDEKESYLSNYKYR